MNSSLLAHLDNSAVRNALIPYLDWEGELPRVNLSSFDTFDDVEAFIADNALAGEEGEKVATVFLELLTIDTLRSKDQKTIRWVGELLQTLLNSDKSEHAFLVVNAVSELGLVRFKPFLPMMLQSTFGPEVIKDAVEKLDETQIQGLVKALSNKGSALSLLAITSVVEDESLNKMLPFFPNGIIPYFVALSLKAPLFDSVVKRLIKADLEINGTDRLDHWIEVFLVNLRDLSTRLTTSEQTAEGSKAQLKKLQRLLTSFNLTNPDWVIGSTEGEPRPDGEELFPTDHIEAISATELEDCLMEIYPKRLARALAQYPYSKKRN